MAPHVWYAGYGSNLSRHRFERYLHGGIPAGGFRRYRGATDRTLPTSDRPFRLPYQLRFGGASRTWGGGMAFVDVRAPGWALARLYRISAAQFADVHAQENAGLADPADLSAIVRGQSVHAGRGNYPLITCCGDVEGEPILLFTTQQLPTPAAPRPPYLRAISAGLAEAHGLRSSDIVTYLRATPEVAPVYDVAALSAIVREGVAAAMVPPPRHSSPS